MLADRVPSTEGMCRYVKEAKEQEIIVGTEVGIIHRLKKENPRKVFYPASEQAVCPNMKLITLEKVLWSLEDLVHEVRVPEDYMGDVMGDISSRRGKILGMDSDGITQIIRANVPLKELFHSRVLSLFLCLQTVEIQMVKGNPSRIFVDEDERGAGHVGRFLYPHPRGQSFDQMGLACCEVSDQRDHVPGPIAPIARPTKITAPDPRENPLILISPTRNPRATVKKSANNG